MVERRRRTGCSPGGGYTRSATARPWQTSLAATPPGGSRWQDAVPRSWTRLWRNLLDKVDSKFTLVALSSKRARQINSYYNQLGESLGVIVPPQVTSVSGKPLTIAFEEIAGAKTTYHRTDPESDEEGAELVGVEERWRGRGCRGVGRAGGVDTQAVVDVESHRRDADEEEVPGHRLVAMSLGSYPMST